MDVESFKGLSYFSDLYAYIERRIHPIDRIIETCFAFEILVRGSKVHASVLL